MAIGIRRYLVDEDIKNSKFMPLLRNVAAFKIRYYDKRQHTDPVDYWRYPDVKPWYLEVSIWRNLDEGPYVALWPVPGANSQ